MFLPLEIRYKIIELLPFEKIIHVSEYLSKKLYEDSRDIIAICIEKGDLDLIKWLYSNKLLTEFFHADDLLLQMVELDHLHVIMWMYDNKIGDCQKFTLAQSYECSERTIMFLHDNYNVCSKMLVDRLFYNRRLSIAEKLYDCCGCSKRALITACYAGDLDIVKFLFGKNISRYDKKDGELIDSAASKGHLDIVIFLHENTDEKSTVKAIDLAAECGHFHVVKWLNENLEEGCTTKAIDKASENGHMKIVEYLVSHGKECTEYSIVNARMKGHMDIVYFLQEMVKEFLPYRHYPIVLDLF